MDPFHSKKACPPKGKKSKGSKPQGKKVPMQAPPKLTPQY